MITISELFPLYRTARKWQSLRIPISSAESVRLENEYTIQIDSLNEIFPNIKEQEWCIDNKLHQSGKPAFISTHLYSNGDTFEYYYEWYFHGKKHRKDGPAVIHYYYDKKIHYKYWYHHGKTHRKDGPAVVYYRPNGKLWFQKWFDDGYLHRIDGPSDVFYDINGNLHGEEWYRKFHREDGPARTIYWTNGNVSLEIWYRDGSIHREDGPAIIKYRENGSISSRESWINGKKQ